jgi:ATP-dependent helicase/nuclease subunit A
MNAFDPADRDVREAIRTELTANICVEAGAGTGKTTVLVDRIVEVLRVGHARAEQLVVVTFTEKAAAELASRVRRGLEDAMREEAVDEGQRSRLAAAIRGLNHAHIETIHAFAASLLRERPVEAGMDPGFEVLDELPTQLAFRAAWDEWITDEMAADPPPAALLAILNLGLDFRHVREAAERLHRHRHALPLRPYAAAPADADAVISVLRSAAAALSSMHPRMRDPDDKAYAAIPVFVELCQGWLALTEGDGAFQRALATVSWPDYNGAQRNWFDADDCRRTKSQMDRIKAAAGEYVMALRSAATGDLVRWLESFVRFYEQRRRRGGVADFDDLLIRARDLIRDTPEVRRYFQEKYRCILVDEFQDTDPLQAETIVRLCAEDGGEPDWRQARLRPGALFVVGDPKQSIYRFRGADITMYDDVKKHIFDGERAIVQNFRSAAPIIAWVNEVFERMITPQPGVQPAYIALEHHPGFEAGAVTLVRGAVPAASKIADIREAEAVALASLIAREVGAGAWPVRQEADAAPRAATWRDVAVLIPSRTELQIYEDAFARQSVPYRHEGGRAFFVRQEVRELVAVLRAIDDPSDGIAAVAALRSSAFGCSDEDLFLHWSAGGSFDHAAMKRSEVEAVMAGLDALRAFAAMRHDTPLPDLVRSVLDRTRLVEFAMLQPQAGRSRRIS